MAMDAPTNYTNPCPRREECLCPPLRRGSLSGCVFSLRESRVHFSKARSVSLSSRRAKLIKRGMIYSLCYGYLDFTVPLFGDFLKRVM
jgi:hypothetical protein